MSLGVGFDHVCLVRKLQNKKRRRVKKKMIRPCLLCVSQHIKHAALLTSTIMSKAKCEAIPPLSPLWLFRERRLR
ncbi:hypothetical protein MTR_5g013345 [Medicago truncatula]|uniref:Uncharacterized protein n=1 Tax=Medicago truncatula TaxID=3880 RepID=A0A072UNQ8_MEDTR|nr:hypothetical protein MTR_5g013345 [Medicago truncatula]